uniref:Uncharacterized protein n=1 Tax=Siphoviridae sp. ctvok7 TaxID=2827596 RepID=A0A8S5LLT8_9CAUD|nr:MAG TPA: hypothetical protein [Siphoviridae sp. ctvok7]
MFPHREVFMHPGRQHFGTEHPEPYPGKSNL